MPISKPVLRASLIEKRRAISPAQQKLAADQLCRHVLQLSCFASATNIALYWPNNGEISPLPLLDAALSKDKRCFLPVINLQTREQLTFAAYTSDTPLVKNRYGILEPSNSIMVEAYDLDIIFIPLVGFDKVGARLGRGGGFYDGTLAKLSQQSKNKQPQLIGLAYALQEVATIPTDIWDRHLDLVITEERIFNFNHISE